MLTVNKLLLCNEFRKRLSYKIQVGCTDDKGVFREARGIEWLETMGLNFSIEDSCGINNIVSDSMTVSE